MSSQEVQSVAPQITSFGRDLPVTNKKSSGVTLVNPPALQSLSIEGTIDEMMIWRFFIHYFLGGGFKYLLFSSLPGGMIQLNWNHQLDYFERHRKLREFESRLGKNCLTLCWENVGAPDYWDERKHSLGKMFFSCQKHPQRGEVLLL